MCEHLGWSDKGLKACLMNETNGNHIKFNWSDRDFNVDVDMISKFISLFLLRKYPIAVECTSGLKRMTLSFTIHIVPREKTK